MGDVFKSRFHCYKTADVAQALRTTRSGVKHRLKQANKLLRTQLEGWYYDEE